jgi:hypothetical protein
MEGPHCAVVVRSQERSRLIDAAKSSTMPAQRAPLYACPYLNLSTPEMLPTAMPSASPVPLSVP